MVGAAGEKALTLLPWAPLKGTKGARDGTEWKIMVRSKHTGGSDLGAKMNKAVVELFEEMKDFLSVFWWRAERAGGGRERGFAEC